MPRRPRPYDDDRADRGRRKSQFVALNQQLLAFACVLAVAIAAGGVMRLDIVPRTPDAQALLPAVRTGDAYVATKPVKPKVREVAAKTAPIRTPSTPTDTGPRLIATSSPERVTGYATVGVTWDESDPMREDQVRFEVRTRKAASGWTAWQRMEYHDDHGPDRGEKAPDRTLRQGTEPDVVGEVAAVQFRVFSTLGRAPHGMRWVLIDPGHDKVVKRAPSIDTASLAATKHTESHPSAATSRRMAQAGISLSAMKVAPKPKIYSRAQWGADEKLREQGPPEYGTIKTGFVHHTVNANDYTAAQVPALLRSIYAYHVISRGWRDIGYNFLVDRFGRIWEGRYGGVDKAVVGAHTLGYNEVSFAMSAIGNYDIARPPQAVIDAYARLFAWKLSLYGISADATHLWVKNRYLNAINGHRDVGQTACPGRYLYAKIPEIRSLAAKIQRTGKDPSGPSPTPTPTPNPDMPVPAADLPDRISVTGKGWPDLIVREKGSDRVEVVPTLGMLRFGDPVTTAGDWSGYDLVVPVGDVTGDGDGDLLVRDKASGTTYVRPGDGSGKAGAPEDATHAFASYTWISPARGAGGSANALIAGDGKRVYRIVANGDGTFAKPTVLLRGYAGGRLIGVGDLDGDGTKDLAALDARHRIRLYRGTVAGFAAPETIGTAPADATSLIGSGDLTRDGVQDLVVRTTTRTGSGTDHAVVVLPGTTQGRVGVPLSPLSALGDATSVNLGSMIGDGSLRDTLALTGVTPDGLVVAASNRRGTVGRPIDTGLHLRDASQLLGVGDWNGDGRSDLVVRSRYRSTLWLRLGDGKGGFGKAIVLGRHFDRITGLSAVGDITGDRHPDLVGRNASGDLRIFPGNGSTGRKPTMTPTTRLRSFNQIGTGTWSATATGNRFVGAGSFVPFVGANGARLLGHRYDWVIGRGDADGDGRADLIARARGTADLYLIPGTKSGLGKPRLLATGLGGYDLGG